MCELHYPPAALQLGILGSVYSASFASVTSKYNDSGTVSACTDPYTLNPKQSCYDLTLATKSLALTIMTLMAMAQALLELL